MKHMQQMATTGHTCNRAQQQDTQQEQLHATGRTSLATHCNMPQHTATRCNALQTIHINTDGCTRCAGHGGNRNTQHFLGAGAPVYS